QPYIDGRTAGTSSTVLGEDGTGSVALRPSLLQLLVNAQVDLRYTHGEEQGPPTVTTLSRLLALAGWGGAEPTTPPTEETAPGSEGPVTDEPPLPAPDPAPSDPVEDDAPPAAPAEDT